MNIDECFFYHTMDLPGHGVVQGDWDIRGRESQYLGEVAFRNKRVLEVGPASGQLSFFMEGQGAEVVSVEAAENSTARRGMQELLRRIIHAATRVNHVSGTSASQ